MKNRITRKVRMRSHHSSLTIKYLGLFALVLALALSVYLMRTFTIYKSRAAVTTQSSIYIDTGSPLDTYTDFNWKWSADYGYVGGTILNNGSTPIGNTGRDNIFQTARVGMSAYHIPVVNGTYSVELEFAEIDPNVTAGQRVFSVDLEGVGVMNNYDIYKTVGPNSAQIATPGVHVTDGVLDITFTKILGEPIINGITITPLPNVTVYPTIPSGQNDTTLRMQVDYSSAHPFDLNYTFPVYIDMSTVANQIIGADIAIKFDPTKLRVNDITAGNYFTNPTVTGKVLDNVNGIAKITVFTPLGTSGRSGAVGTIAQLSFTTIGVGTTEIGFGTGTLVAATDAVGFNVLKYSFGSEISIAAPTSSSSPTLTLPPFASATPTNVPSATRIPSPTITRFPSIPPTHAISPTSSPSPTPTPSGELGDVNSDGCIDILDFVSLLAQSRKISNGQKSDGRLDLNGDGRINILDYKFLFDHFGRCRGRK